MHVGLSKEELAEISHKLVEHNSRLVHSDDDLGLIQFVTPGEYAPYAGRRAGFSPEGSSETPQAYCKSGLRGTVCVHTFPLPFELWADKMRTGVHLVTPSIRHVPPQCYDPAIKNRSRFHYYLADQEARLTDPHASALLLDLEGNVTETSTANFLMIEQGTIVSPTTRNILPGISRATAVELAGRLGLRFAERDFDVATAQRADEALVASTPYCVMPVTRLNGTPVGDGRPGPTFRRLLAAWSQEAGLDVARQIQEGAQRRQDA